LNDTTGTIGVVANPSPGQDTQFDWRLLSNVAYRWNGFNAGFTWRFLPKIDNQAQVTSPTSTVQGTPSYSVFNLFGSYSFAKTQIRIGIDNVLDKEPPVVGSNPGNAAGIGRDSNADITNPGFYDALGRRYYVGVKTSF